MDEADSVLAMHAVEYPGERCQEALELFTECRPCHPRVGRPAQREKCGSCVRDRQRVQSPQRQLLIAQCVFLNNSPKCCTRCLSKNRQCQPRKQSSPDSDASSSQASISHHVADADRASAFPWVPPQVLSSQASLEFVFSELQRQLPSLEGYEIFALSQHLSERLRDVWNQIQISLAFRRIKVIENVSRASITVLDFQSVPQASVRTVPHPCQTIVGTVIMSEVPDPTHPEMQPRCIWSQVNNGPDNDPFSTENSHLTSALPIHTSSRTQNVYGLVAVRGLKQLYKHTRFWNPGFTSAESAIQRACAWGIVSSVADKFEYRLFAASVTRFFETYLDSVNRPSAERFATSPDDNKNDLTYVLKPFVRVLDKDIGASQKAMND